jgi:ABC-type phosphate/phosphonate transport system substrate-binding protein
MFVTKHARCLTILLAILLFDTTRGSQAVGQTPGRFEAKAITLGLVTERNQKEVEAHFQDFVRYLATKLSTASNVEGRVVVVPTQSRLANLLMEKKADFYMESPYPLPHVDFHEEKRSDEASRGPSGKNHRV